MTDFASESFSKSAVEEAPENSLVFLDLQLDFITIKLQ